MMTATLPSRLPGLDGPGAALGGKERCRIATMRERIAPQDASCNACQRPEKQGSALAGQEKEPAGPALGGERIRRGRTLRGAGA